jgi:methionyl aminopeptidase
MIGRNDFCWCGSGKKWKKCHFPALPSTLPSALPSASEYAKRYGIILKTEKQIEGIRAACRLSSQILEATCALCKPGVTTLELNDFAHKMHLDAGAIPAPLGYGTPPFPKSICTSLNEVVCHGIPDLTSLKEGDILNIDVTCILNGYYGDCSRMVEIGTIDRTKRRVVDTAYECLMRAIAGLRPGVFVSHIGQVIQSFAELAHCSVVTEFVGHGVGLQFHEEPHIPHFKNQLLIPLAPGMTFTVEPMINAGRKEVVIDNKDRWTARTIDNEPSAQWEHTILITEDGYELLTSWKL